MKSLLTVVILLLPLSASTDEVVSKWTGEDGRVHYGDAWTVDEDSDSQKLVIPETFDEASYKAAVARNREYEKEARDRLKRLRKLEKEARRKGKRPLTASEKYDLYLEQEEKKHQLELERKRMRRAEYRRRWRMDCNDSRNATKIACR